MCSDEQIFVIKCSPWHQPWRSFCRRAVDLTGSKKALHVNSKVTLTVNGNFCSSMSRYEHGRSFLSTRRDGLHWYSLSYIHYDVTEAPGGKRRTPRHRHAKQLHVFLLEQAVHGVRWRHLYHSNLSCTEIAMRLGGSQNKCTLRDWCICGFFK